MYISHAWLYWSSLFFCINGEDIFTFNMALNSDINKFNPFNYTHNWFVVVYKYNLCYNM